MEDNFLKELREWIKNNPITESDYVDATNSNSMKGDYNPMYGRVHTEETKEAIRQKAIGRKMPDGWGKEHAEKLKGKKHSLESRMKRARYGKDNAMFGKSWNEDDRLKRRLKLGMKVTIKGIEYNSKREAAKILKVSRPTIDNWVKNGQ